MHIKKMVAAHAVAEIIKSKDRVGLGSGSTAIHCVGSLADLIENGTLTEILCAASSFETLAECYRYNLAVRELGDPCFRAGFDVFIDGADEVSSQGALIKGGGGAHLMEKIMASHSTQLVIVADSSKLVEVLGSKAPVPVEIIPQARYIVEKKLRALGGRPELRDAARKLGPVITEQGNIILDVYFSGIEDPKGLDRDLQAIAGLVEHGIFIMPSIQFIIAPDGSITKKSTF